MIRTRSVPVRAWKGVSRPLRGVREPDLDLSLAIERVVQHITSDLARLSTYYPTVPMRLWKDEPDKNPCQYADGRIDASTVLLRTRTRRWHRTATDQRLGASTVLLRTR